MCVAGLLLECDTSCLHDEIHEFVEFNVAVAACCVRLCHYGHDLLLGDQRPSDEVLVHDALEQGAWEVPCSSVLFEVLEDDGPDLLRAVDVVGSPYPIHGGFACLALSGLVLYSCRWCLGLRGWLSPFPVAF